MSPSPSARDRFKQVLKDGSDIHHHMEFLREHSWGNVMEIGVRQGASTSALLAGIEEKGGHLWSVDKADWWGDCFSGHPNWTFIHADSTRDFRKIKEAIPDSLDFLLIDGDHGYEAVLGDLINYGDRAKMIALHDAEESPVRTAVSDYCAWNELDYEVRKHSFGMAVITR